MSDRTGRTERFAVLGLRYIGALFMFALMSVTCVDIAGRYLFNRPLMAGTELTEVFLALVIFIGLPLVTLRNDHVTVDLFDPITPDRLFRLQHVIASIIGVICIAYLSWQLWLRAETVTIAGETTPALRIQLGWIAYSMSVLMALTALAMLLVAFRRPQRHIPEP